MKQHRPTLLSPRSTYADERQLIETLASVVRAILIRRQQAVVQSEHRHKQDA